MRIMTISDLHSPFTHPAALDFLADLKHEVKPELVVCLGDEIDAHGWSRWGRHPESPGQAEELEQAKALLTDVFKLFPKALVCESNHSERAVKMAATVGLPSQWIRSLREVFDAPRGWQWAERHEADDCLFIHGEGFSGQNSALQACRLLRRNVCMGHVHCWAGVQYLNNGDETVWGMNAGCLIDPASVAMRYAKQSPNKSVLGTGVIMDGVPTFVPLR